VIGKEDGATGGLLVRGESTGAALRRDEVWGQIARLANDHYLRCKINLLRMVGRCDKPT
jgi:hypothetical protein